jgi:hypothetical protein
MTTYDIGKGNIQPMMKVWQQVLEAQQFPNYSSLS